MAILYVLPLTSCLDCSNCDAPGCCCIAGGHQWQLFNLSTVVFFLGYVIHWLSWFSQSNVATEQTLGHSSPKLWTVGSDINSVITSIEPRKARIYTANNKCDVYDVFSPNRVSTLRGSYGRCKGRCLIRVLTLGPGLFSFKFPYKVALKS